jgi:hypothetical protein
MGKEGEADNRHHKHRPHKRRNGGSGHSVLMEYG